MQTILLNDGDSAAAIIADALLKKLGLEVGDQVEIVVEGDRLIVTKADDTFED